MCRAISRPAPPRPDRFDRTQHRRASGSQSREFVRRRPDGRLGQGAMRTRRLLIGPALLDLQGGVFRPLRRRSKPFARYTGQPLRARRMTDRS
jgi:hypothetical protein